MRSDKGVPPAEHDRAHTFQLGARGESLAIAHLERSGYRIVAANFTLPIGRNLRERTVNAEIDIVAYDGPILCFIEVKARVTDDFAPPQTNIDLRKRRQISRAARGYRRMFGLTNSPFRYDVITVVGKPDDERPRIKLQKAFWSDEQLRKISWQDAYWY